MLFSNIVDYNKVRYAVLNLSAPLNVGQIFAVPFVRFVPKILMGFFCNP
jgi:hypothetical protein